MISLCDDEVLCRVETCVEKSTCLLSRVCIRASIPAGACRDAGSTGVAARALGLDEAGFVVAGFLKASSRAPQLSYHLQASHRHSPAVEPAAGAAVAFPIPVVLPPMALPNTAILPAMPLATGTVVVGTKVVGLLDLASVCPFSFPGGFVVGAFIVLAVVASLWMALAETDCFIPALLE